jgi:hypothetical protein
MDTRAIRTVADLYPRLWLKPEDLGGRKITVKITGAEVREFRQRDGEMKPAVVLTFERAQRRMILNKTQTLALAELTGSPAFADWPGHTVALAQVTGPTGRPTIAVTEADTAQ